MHSRGQSHQAVIRISDCSEQVCGQWRLRHPAGAANIIRRLSDRQGLALDALAECAADRGNAPPANFGLPAGLLAVNISSWREELFSRGVLDRDAASPHEDLKRVKNSLHARRLIGIRDDLVWRA